MAFVSLMVFALSCNTQKEKSEESSTVKQNIPTVSTETELSKFVGSYKVVAMDGMGEIEQNNPYFTITKSGRISGYNGCNSFSGEILSDSDKVILSKLGTTRMACQGDKNSTEKVFMELMNRTTGMNIGNEGQLDFMTDGAVVLSAKKMSLGLGNFYVKTVRGEAPKTEGVMFTIEEGRISGNTGCNSFYGSLVQNGVRLTMGDLAATEQQCEEVDPIFETKFIKALQVTNRFDATDNLYTFYEGNTVTFTALKD